MTKAAKRKYNKHNTIMKKTTRKTSYTSPEVELLVVRCEQNLLTGSNPDGTWDNAIKGGSTWGSNAYDGNNNPYGLE